MKEYILLDSYEGEELIGEYDTIDEARAAAYDWIQETDGDCELSYFTKCKECGKYHKITL